MIVFLLLFAVESESHCDFTKLSVPQIFGTDITPFKKMAQLRWLKIYVF